jgi:hypothetical protein
MRKHTRSLGMTALKTSPLVVAILSLAIAAPAFAQGGGGRTRNGNNNNNNSDVSGNDFGGNNNGNNNGNNGGGRTRGRGGNNNNNNGVAMDRVTTNGGGGPGNGRNNGGGGSGGIGRAAGRNNFTQLQNSEDYGILTTTSIFARNRIAIDNSISETTQPQPTKQGPAPVFVGVMKDDDGYVAFVESGGSVAPVKAGEKINWDNSTVKSVSMDKMQVQSGETVSEIPLGYNLRNEPAQPVPSVIVPPVSADVSNRGNYATGGGNVGNNNNFGGRNGGNFGGNFGGGFGGNFGGRGQRNFGGNNFGGPGGNNFGPGAGTNNFGPGGGNNNFGNVNWQNFGSVTPVVSTDPPLPAGTTDDLEARMKARRAQQTGGN